MALQVWLPLLGDINNQGLSDVTIANNNATIDNSGKLGKCYSFNGSSQYIKLTGYANLGDTFTVALWFCGTNGALFCDRTTGYAGLGIYLNNTVLTIDPVAASYGSKTRWATSFIASANIWYHLVVTRTPTTVSQYINGEFKQSKDVIFADSYGNCITLGCYNKNGSSVATYFTGKINDVRIYDHVLSPKEIKLLSQGLVCHYQLNDINTETIVYDSSGNKYNGEKVGNVTSDNVSPRNTTSMSFVNGSYLRLQNMIVSGYTNSYTFAWWGKFGNCNGHMMWGFANGNRLNLFSYSTNCYWNTGDSLNNPFNIALSPYLDSNFHHFAITGDGTTTKLYIDGEYKADAKTYKGITGTTLIFNGWDTGNNYNFNGGLSDFRLYATPLSAKDIQILYNTPVSVTNVGTMTTYGEFVEVTSL